MLKFIIKIKLEVSIFKANVIRYKMYEDHNDVVDKMHYRKNGKLQISSKLNDNCKTNIKFGIRNLDNVGINSF